MFSKTDTSDALADQPQPASASGPTTARGRGMPTLISEDMNIHGDISGKDEIQIEGKVVGTVICGSLVIGSGGRVEGEVTADSVHVAGNVTGEIKAGSLTMAATARVDGDIEVRDGLSIEMGAVFEGSTRRAGSAGETTPKSDPARLPAPKIVVAG